MSELHKNIVCDETFLLIGISAYVLQNFLVN